MRRFFTRPLTPSSLMIFLKSDFFVATSLMDPSNKTSNIFHFSFLKPNK